MRKALTLGVLASIFLSISAIAEEIKIDTLLKKKWVEARSEHFILVTDIKPKHAESLVKSLEEYRVFIHHFTRTPPLTDVEPLFILAPSKSSSFKALNLPENWAGVMVKGLDSAFAIANLTGFRASARNPGQGNHVLMHEYVHYAMRNSISPKVYPFWYSEGIAEYLATYRVKKGALSVGSINELQYRFYELLNPSRTRYGNIDLESLFKAQDVRTNWDDEDDRGARRDGIKNTRLMYARSVATLHYLYSSYETESQLNSYIDLINTGLPVDTAFQLAFNTSYDALEKDITSYLNGGKLYGRTYTPGEEWPQIDALVSIRELSDAEILDSLHRTVAALSSTNSEDADAIFERLMALAPSHPEALAREAWKQYRRTPSWLATSDPELNSFIDTALEAAPNNASLIALDAERQFAETRTKLWFGEPIGNALPGIRNRYREAIRLNNNTARAYAGLGRLAFYNPDQSKQLDEEAMVCLDSARVLAGDHYFSKLSQDEAILKLKHGDTLGALLLLRKSIALADSWWTKFVLTTLEFKHTTDYESASNARGLNFANGAMWRGEVLNGLPHGNGTLTLIDGSRLEGRWQEGRLNGQGIMTTATGYVYQGAFEDSSVTGNGKLSYPESSSLEYSEGEFLHGMEHGPHRFVFDDGVVEASEFKLMSSYGELTIMRPGAEPKKIYSFDGRRRVPLEDGTLFSGRTKKHSKGDGFGLCKRPESEQIFACAATDGVLSEKVNKIFESAGLAETKQ